MACPLDWPNNYVEFLSSFDFMEKPRFGQIPEIVPPGRKTNTDSKGGVQKQKHVFFIHILWISVLQPPPPYPRWRIL